MAQKPKIEVARVSGYINGRRFNEVPLHLDERPENTETSKPNYFPIAKNVRVLIRPRCNSFILAERKNGATVDRIFKEDVFQLNGSINWFQEICGSYAIYHLDTTNSFTGVLSTMGLLMKYQQS